VETINERTRQALDTILDILKGIRIQDVRGLLNDVATIYERRGPHVAEVFVVGKREDSAFRRKHAEIDGLVRIIGVLNQERLPRAEASYILKKLEAIDKFYGQAKGEEA
jgi:hypothetical protein